MSYHRQQLREFITEVLTELEQETKGKIKMSKQALDLLMMTAAHESALGSFLKQTNGPALGAFQMEPATHEDHWDYITHREWLYTAFCRMNLECDTEARALMYNLKYAIVMARVHYYRKPEPIPTDLMGIAEYAKEHYNTPLGKAKVLSYYEDYLRYCT